jgi:hypothetical protein
MSRCIVFLANICMVALLCSAQTTNDQSVPSLESISPDKRLETPRTQTEWDRGNVISIDSRGKSTDFSCVYQIRDLNNILITAKGKSGGQQIDEQMMLIEGRWMLEKGMTLVKGYELDYLDTPLLNLKLALHLLSDAASAGPADIKTRSTFKVKDQKTTFVVATLSASLPIDAPWSLNATIEPVAADKFSFDLNVKAHPSMRINGTWQKDPSLHVLDGDTPLEGWQIYSIEMAKEQQGAFMRYEIVAKPSEVHPKNLGELRQLTKK